MKKNLTLPGLLLGLGLGLSAAGQTLVKDIVPGLSGSSPRSLTPMVGGVLFVASDNTAVNGNLWRTDGTTAGTTLVRATAINSNGIYRSDLVKMGAFVYFAATDAATGAELWKSDGTAAGTVLVKDIAVGVRGSGPKCLTVMNNRL